MSSPRKLASVANPRTARPKRAKLTERESLKRMREFSKRKEELVSVRRSAERIEAEVMKLDLSVRAALAEKLLSSLDNLTEAENEALWAEEAERRAEELRSGKVIALDGEEVMRRARQAIS